MAGFRCAKKKEASEWIQGSNHEGYKKDTGYQYMALNLEKAFFERKVTI